MTAVVEMGFARAHAPLVTSDWAGAAHAVLSLSLVLSLSVLPVAILGLAWDRWLRRSYWPDPARLTSIVTGAIVSVAGVFLVLDVFESHPANEFPARLNLLRAVALIAVSGMGTALTVWVLMPAARRLMNVTPHLARPRVIPSAIGAVAVLVAFFVVHVGLAPIHLSYQIGVVSFCGVALTLVVARWVVVGLPRVVLRVAAISWLVSCLFAFVLSVRNDHARFVLFAQCPGGSAVAGTLRDILDFDGDGTAGTWVGGTDCASFDPLRGPARVEIPGDGIDQDCRGGDAAEPRTVGSPALWSHCEPPRDRPNILLVTVDALRASAVRDDVMPQLFGFSHLALDFRRAYAPTTQTPFSMASIFSGRVASDLGTANMIEQRDLDMGRGLPDRLAASGYDTLVFSEFPLPKALTLGFQKVNPHRSVYDTYPFVAKLSFASAGMTTAILASLDEPRVRPFFVWVHYPDAHAPYLVSPAWAPSHLSPYEREAAYVDYHIGRLLEGLRSRDLASKTIVAITADHGEDLGVRGREGHGPDAYESAIHVPLLLWVAGCQPRRFEEPVSLSRLGPTLAALAAMEMPGRTLMPHEGPEVPVVSEVVQVLDLFKRAIIGTRYKLIVDVRNGGRVLFDLQEDPRETHNIYDEERAAAAAMEAAYQSWLDNPGYR